MKACVIAAATTVHKSPIAKRDFFYFHTAFQMRSHHFPEKETVTGAAAAGMKGQYRMDTRSPSAIIGQQLFYEIAAAFL